MLIKNGIMIDPATDFEGKADIRIKEGLIKEIGPDLFKEAGEEVIDASGCMVAPGLVDTHVHFRDPGLTYKEDLHTGALAAARGGFTTVICMANTKPVIDSVEAFKEVQRRAEREAIHIYQAASISKGLKGKEPADMEALTKAGVLGFTDDGIPLVNAAFCYQAMERAASLHVPVSLHEEDPSFINNNGINHGAVSDKLGILASPSMAEISLVARDCQLALSSGADVVIQHISTGGAVDLVRTFRQKGAHLHAEATPHHFTLTEEAVLKHGTLAKMNPPLRTEADRLEIIRGLKDGTIDIIATDHAPHSPEEKAKPLTEAPSGIIGLETSLSLGISSLVRPGHLTLMELLRKMTLNPADLYHLPCGRINIGGPADLVIFNPEETWKVTGFASKSSNSPFLGHTLHGKIHHTICGGRVVF